LEWGIKDFLTIYSNADLEKLLGVKGHVIRYWEKEFPLIQPRRDMHGHFIYGQRDVEFVLRLKHLLYDRKFTVEGAREQLLCEVSAPNQEKAAAISALRADLLNIYFTNHRLFDSTLKNGIENRE
jgi:DNA-binding transcriptional MerR regulator